MSNEERSKRVAELGVSLGKIAQELDELHEELALQIDRQVVSWSVLEIRWAAEILPIVAKHQIGQALDNDFGMSWH